MIVIYQNAKGDEVHIGNVIHLQNVEGGVLEAVTGDNKILTLLFDRIEAVVDESLFGNDGRNG